jgi:hypothetical protein
MKLSRNLDKPFLLGFTALAMSAATSFLPACSSDDAPATSNLTSTKEPSEPGASPSDPASPTAPTETPPAPETPTSDDCKVAPPSEVCGVSPQCGCPTGQTCDVLDSVGTARCIAAGDAPMGHPCDTTGECAQGLTCIFNICHAFCNDPTTTCSQPGTGACAQITTTDGVPVPNLAICRVACAPHDPMSCGGTTSAGTGVCRVDDKGESECQFGGERKENETCTPEDDCGPGLICARSGSSGTCKRWCRIGENDCGTGKRCTGFSKEVRVRGVSYGACN